MWDNVGDNDIWDKHIGAQKIHDALGVLLAKFFKQVESEVLTAGDDKAILRAYVIEWGKFSSGSAVELPFTTLDSFLKVCLHASLS